MVALAWASWTWAPLICSLIASSLVALALIWASRVAACCWRLGEVWAPVDAPAWAAVATVKAPTAVAPSSRASVNARVRWRTRCM